MQNKTVGIVGAGRIGSAYARMMAEGHKCNILYHDPYQNKFLEDYIADYSKVQQPYLLRGDILIPEARPFKACMSLCPDSAGLVISTA